jgi:hypothetical protein
VFRDTLWYPPELWVVERGEEKIWQSSQPLYRAERKSCREMCPFRIPLYAGDYNHRYHEKPVSVLREQREEIIHFICVPFDWKDGEGIIMVISFVGFDSQKEEI